MIKTASRIRVFGDPVLRKKAQPVKEITQVERDILSQMSGVMYESLGIGLAAPQIGISSAMIVVDIGHGLYKLINPKIIKREGRQVMDEGCLSVPGVCIGVKRAQKVVIQAQDENGKAISLEAEDLLACVFQHEIDHLNGKLIVDYASFLEKIKAKKKLEALKRKSENEKLSESETKSCKLQL